MPETAAVDGRVSVALCTYNGAVFLEEQLASMLAQTVLPGEIVVSDDGSTDGTSAIVERCCRLRRRGRSGGVTTLRVVRNAPAVRRTGR